MSRAGRNYQQQGNSTHSAVIEVTPTIDTSAYTSGDRLGSIQTLEGAVRLDNGRAILHSLVIIDAAAQSADMDILIFDQSPTVASADNAAISLTDSELADKLVGIVQANLGYVTVTSGGQTVTSVNNIGLVCQGSVGSIDLYALPVVRAAPTYGSTSDLVFKYGFLQE